MTTLNEMRRELREKFDRLPSNPNKYYTREDLLKMSKTEIVEFIVSRMDIATLWRWKTLIDKRLKEERVKPPT